MEIEKEKGLSLNYFIKEKKYRVIYSGLNIIKMIFVNSSNGFQNGNFLLTET